MSDTKNKYPFDALAESRGYSPEKLRGFTDNCKNVSHLLKGKGSEGKPIVIKIDLKKVKNKKQNEDWLWLEFKNSYGNPGWIHGDAHFVVFERTEDFVFVNRKELLSWCGSSQKLRYDLPFVNLAKRAKYRIYRRNDTKEEVTQVELKELKKLESFKVWKK
mgnify:FL=1|jgi:hypothetical protein